MKANKYRAVPGLANKKHFKKFSKFNLRTVINLVILLLVAFWFNTPVLLAEQTPSLDILMIKKLDKLYPFVVVLTLGLFILIAITGVLTFLIYKKCYGNISSIDKLDFSPISGHRNINLSNLDNIERTLKDILDNIKRLTETQENINTILKGETFDAIQNPEKEKPQSQDEFVKEICEIYNSAIDNPNKRGDFLKEYKPIRIGISKEDIQKRRSNAEYAAVFQQLNDGDMYAVPIWESTKYAIIPRFGLIFQEPIFGPGGLREVFVLPDYDQQYKHTTIKLKKPAIFETDSDKKIWILKEKGYLD